jgi:hypothetical protein
MVAIEIQVKEDSKIDLFLLITPNIAIIPFAFILHISSYSKIVNRYQSAIPHDCSEKYEPSTEKD